METKAFQTAEMVAGPLGTVTITSAAIAPARYIWSPDDKVLILSETLTCVETAAVMHDWATAMSLRAVLAQVPGPRRTA